MLSRRKAPQSGMTVRIPGCLFNLTLRRPWARDQLAPPGWSERPGRERINTALTNLSGVPRTIPHMADQPLQVENLEGSRAGHRILRLTGPLTLSNLFQFQAQVRAEKAPVLIIDLTNVPYIDSAGIGSLMGAHVSRQKNGHSLTLAGVSKRVKDALEVTRVLQFFAFYPSVAEAEDAASHP